MKEQDLLNVVAHLRGEMTEEERLRFVKRLADDPGLASASERTARLLLLLDRWQPPGASGDLTGEVMEKVAREPRHRPVDRVVAFPQREAPAWWKRVMLPGTAAIAAAAAALALWIGVSPEKGPSLRQGQTGPVTMGKAPDGSPRAGVGNLHRPVSRDLLPELTLLLEVTSLDTAEQEIRERMQRLGIEEVHLTKSDNAVVVDAVVPAGADLVGAFSGYGRLLSHRDGYRTTDGRSVVVIRLRGR